MDSSLLVLFFGLLLGLLIGGGFIFFIKQKSSNKGEAEVSSKLDILENSFKNISEINTRQIGELKKEVAAHLKQSRETLN